ncbi:MAG: DUF3467 domain-containing protein [candidate division KSB1 bacterium]|nr:DUF3467 domain-containing protein [candidate division KSB1 bacterium]
MTNHQTQQINIEIGEKEAEGIYANLAIISHSPAEFVMDFTRVLPGIPKSKIYARIIMTPQHAKSLLAALKDNIAKYEAQYGEIKIVNEPSRTGTSIGFQPQASSDSSQSHEPATS